MLEGDVLAQKWSGVESNVSKRQIWAPDPASLEAVRDYPSVRGTPAAPPDGKYAGGTLRGIRVLGAYLGDDEWRKTELVARVERALKPLEGILKLRDTKEIHPHGAAGDAGPAALLQQHDAHLLPSRHAAATCMLLSATST